MIPFDLSISKISFIGNIEGCLFTASNTLVSVSFIFYFTGYASMQLIELVEYLDIFFTRGLFW